MLIQWDMDTWFGAAGLSWATESYGDPLQRYRVWHPHLLGQVTWTMDHDYAFFTRGSVTHWGSSDPMLVVLDSSLEGGASSSYEGMWKFTFHQPGSHIQESDYQVMKQLYLQTCAHRRNGTAWDQPWDEDWSVDAYLRERFDYTTVPYCEWMKHGWDESYIKASASAFGCDRIENIICDGNGYVTHIVMDWLGLHGELPSALASMPQLMSVTMRYNRINGSLVTMFNSQNAFPNLHALNLQHNSLTGMLPCFSDPAPPLYTFDLSHNLLHGQIEPQCLSKATTLQHLILGYNHLHASIPDLSGLTGLAKLELQHNSLTGSMPNTMCALASLFELDLDQNRLVGTLPSACVNPPSGVTGWERMRTMSIEHNRLTGSIPIFGAGMTNLRVVHLDYNYFEGTVTDQFNVLIEHADQGDRTEVMVAGNLLSGPYPELVYRMHAELKTIDRIGVEDNWFRCENTGSFPKWAYRSYAVGSWNYKVIEPGVCRLVPNPTSVTPSSGEVGALIQVEAESVEPSARGTCMFYKDGTEIRAYSAAKVIESAGMEPRFQCFVPTTLASSTDETYKVTVANFGEDFASLAYWSRSSTTFNPPSFTVRAAQAIETGVVVSTVITLTGVTQATFNEASFRQMVSDITQVPVGDITLSFTAPLTLRRLTSGSSLPVYVSINIPADDPSSSETQAIVNAVKERLESPAVVQQAMDSYSFQPESTSLQVSSQDVQPQVVTLGGPGGTESEDQTMLGVALAAAGMIMVCCLCGVVCVIRHREKTGQPYFEEVLEDNNAGGGGNATGATYGNTNPV